MPWKTSTELRTIWWWLIFNSYLKCVLLRIGEALLWHRPTASSATGILPEGCLMTLYVLENQGFPPAPLLRVAPLPGTARPSAEPSFSNLPWVPACTSVFAQPSLPLLSCCCQRIHIPAAASFFHSHTRARWLQQLSYFIIAFVIKNEFFLFYHYPNPNYPSKAFLYNIRFAVLSVGSGIVVHFEI